MSQTDNNPQQVFPAWRALIESGAYGRLSPLAAKVYDVMLFYYRNPNNGLAWPAIDRTVRDDDGTERREPGDLSVKVGRSPRQVREVIKELRDAGLIEKVRHGGIGRLSPTAC